MLARRLIPATLTLIAFVLVEDWEMANNFYYIEDLVSNGSSTVTLVDDGVGSTG
ncbi:hypothetical protein ACFSHQ_21155 [Gemmobacter lanyuensis]